MIGETVVRRTMAYREQVLAHRASEAEPFPGIDGAGDDAYPGIRTPGAGGVSIRRLACADAPACGPA